MSSGRLQVHQLRAWLPDGALIDTQVSDITPEPRELNSAALSQTDSIVLVLALPLLQQGIINVQKKRGLF
ncbi:type VI secretion system baseplate subunit TssK [Providencia stuartii]|uniref:type VI secretion system baseplate subunit TssK n=1 Tax=Providencia stuartii TaxID=588 RepID=UPI0022AB55BD|nr:type VI secretion system baseplate subunit TssK [Providencia stuartii]WAZ73976.1 type VI secretion system baseplate subunit TssK [Providencia stuartii]